MKSGRAVFFDITDWNVLETKNCHFFNADETEFTALSVLVGYYYIDTIDINNKLITQKLDIIRWITESEYNRIIHNVGVMVW